MISEICFDLNNPPTFDLTKLFSIGALIGVEVQGIPTDVYEVIHRLPFEAYSKGGIFVIGSELGLPRDTRVERYNQFEMEIAKLNRGQIVERPATQNVACLSVIIPEKELTIVTILNAIKEYCAIKDVLDVKSSYRNKE